MPKREVHWDDDQGDALAASDEGARLLREGRYAEVAADRPGVRERAAGFVQARRTWQPHLHGWGCLRCGASVHSRASKTRHDWHHRHLEAMFGAVGADVDRLEGELTEVRGELAEAEKRAELAVEQVKVLTEMLGPALSRWLEGSARLPADDYPRYGPQDARGRTP